MNITMSLRTNNVSLNKDLVTLLNRMGTQPTATRISLMNNLINSIQAAGLWSKLESLYLLAGHTQTDSLIDWKVPTRAATIVGTVTFTTDKGFAGNGTTGYLNTGVAPSSSIILTQNSAHAGIWCNVATGASTTRTDFGSSDATSNISLRAYNSVSNDIAYRLNQSTALSATSSTTELGHTILNRTSSTALQPFKNGATLSSTTSTSTGVPTTVLYIGATNSNGTAAGFSNRRYAAFHMGASLTNTEAANLYSYLNTYLTAIGAN